MLSIYPFMPCYPYVYLCYPCYMLYCLSMYRVVHPHDPRPPRRIEARGAFVAVEAEEEAVEAKLAARDPARDDEHARRRRRDQRVAAPAAGAARCAGSIRGCAQRGEAQRRHDRSVGEGDHVGGEGHSLPRQQPLPRPQARAEHERHKEEDGRHGEAAKGTRCHQVGLRCVMNRGEPEHLGGGHRWRFRFVEPHAASLSAASLWSVQGLEAAKVEAQLGQNN